MKIAGPTEAGKFNMWLISDKRIKYQGKSTDSCEQFSGVCDTQFAGFDKPISQNSACNRNNPHHQIRQRRVQSILFSKRISFKIHRSKIKQNRY